MTASHTRRIKISRQRLTTTDENAAKALQDKMTIDLARALCGDENEKSGIIRGCTVSVVVGTMTVKVVGGLGLYYDSTSVSPDSKYRLIEVPDVGIDVTLGAADPVSARWDLIEIQPASVNGTPEVLDFWDPTIGTFVSAPASPLQVSAPVVQVVAGTPGASPKLPTPTAGFIPLAYQYVPGAAVALLGNDTLMVRPMLTPRGDLLDPSRFVPSAAGRISGGGLNMTDGLTTGTIGSDVQGFFRKSHTPFRLPAYMPISLAFGAYDGGGLPASNRLVYFYAIPAPLPAPAGDPNILAPREFFIVDETRIQSGGYYQDQSGCIVVASPEGPLNTNQGQPAIGGTATFVGHPTFDNFTSSRATWAYIGCAYFDFGAGGFVGQRADGDRITPERKPGYDLLADMPIGVAAAKMITATYPGDPAIAYPAIAFDVKMRFLCILDAPDHVAVRFFDVYGDSADPTTAIAWTGYESGTLGDNVSGGEYIVTPNNSGQIVVDFAESLGAPASVDIRCDGYRDGVLALR